MSKERPILFSGPMVNAIREGRKTQTRRLCKQEGCMGCNHPGNILMCWNENMRCSTCDGTRHQPPQDGDPCPYGVPGDHLFVRETLHFEEGASSIVHGCEMRDPGRLVYLADGAEVIVPDGDPEAWANRQRREIIPSIHMPRWACRLVLEVVSVRVERLNDISFADCRAEGCDRDYIEQVEPCARCDGDDPCDGRHFGEKWHYTRVWESINGKGSWALNPWVWVVEFKKMNS